MRHLIGRLWRPPRWCRSKEHAHDVLPNPSKPGQGTELETTGRPRQCERAVGYVAKALFGIRRSDAIREANRPVRQLPLSQRILCRTFVAFGPDL